MGCPKAKEENSFWLYYSGLGADYVHYKKCYTHINLHDLEGIIEIIMNEIVSEETKKKYLKIEKAKKK